MVLRRCEGIIAEADQYFGEATGQVRKILAENSRLPLTKLAALLHDIGKPPTRMEKNNRVTFYGHDKEGCKIAGVIAERLRMSSKDREFLQTIIAEHLHVLSLSKQGVTETARKRIFRNLGDDCIPLLIMGMADMDGIRGPLSDREERAAHLEWSRNSVRSYFEKLKPEMERKSLISGKDLIEQGMQPGPEMGKILRRLQDAQDEGKISDWKSALEMAKVLIKYFQNS
jgi:poly(A) polymerase